MTSTCRFIRRVAGSTNSEHLDYVFEKTSGGGALSINLLQGRSNLILSRHVFAGEEEYDKTFGYLLGAAFSHDPPMKLSLFNSKKTLLPSSAHPRRRNRPPPATRTRGAANIPFSTALDLDSGYGSSDEIDEIDEDEGPFLRVETNSEIAQTPGILLVLEEKNRNLAPLEGDITPSTEALHHRHLTHFQMSVDDIETAISFDIEIREWYRFENRAPDSQCQNCRSLSFFVVPCQHDV